jgi:uncharacterized protein YjbI with pentapeptide repeats
MAIYTGNVQGAHRMANEEHLDILKQGVKTWNQWRNEHQGLAPNLSITELSFTDLSDADLYEANLSGAKLIRANLGTHLGIEEIPGRGANLSGANLSEANLYGANLFRADIPEAVLMNAKWAPITLPKTRGCYVQLHNSLFHLISQFLLVY